MLVSLIKLEQQAVRVNVGNHFNETSLYWDRASVYGGVIGRRPDLLRREVRGLGLRAMYALPPAA